MHTNPIIITFVSIMYYKKLDEFIRRHHIEKRIYLSQNPDKKLRLSVFRGFLPIESPTDPFLKKMNIGYSQNVYNKKIVNKWHLIWFLSKNKSLCVLRKHNFIKEEEEEEEQKTGFVEKVKLKLKSCCSKKKKADDEAIDMEKIDESVKMTLKKSDSIISIESRRSGSKNKIGDSSSFKPYQPTSLPKYSREATIRNSQSRMERRDEVPGENRTQL